MKDFSIIIPFRESTDTLPRLFSSIPDDNNIEIILVDNNDVPVTKEEIGINRQYILLHADSQRYAGGARNVGIEAATGDWILFADSDDYFSEGAFDIFQKYIHSSFDLVYFGCSSVYLNNGLPAKRHIFYNDLVKNVNNSSVSMDMIKSDHDVSWAKMIRKNLIEKNKIRYKEIIASEDVEFAITCGLNSIKTGVDPARTYIVTDHENSLSKMINKDTIEAKIKEIAKKNELLKKYKLNKYRVSILASYYRLLRLNPKIIIIIIHSLIKNRKYIFKDYINIFCEINRRLNPT